LRYFIHIDVLCLQKINFVFFNDYSKLGYYTQEILCKGHGVMKKRILIFVSIFLVALVIVPMFATIILYNRTFARRAESPQYRAFLRYSDIAGYEKHMVNFPSGPNMLTGYIYGRDNYKGLVVVAHSFGDGAEGYLGVITYFVDMGWRVFAYDKTGSHNSEGGGTRGLVQSVLDLDAALTFIAAQEWGLPIVLFGHSWGGFASTAVLNFEHEISAVVSLAGYNRPIQILHDTSRRILGRAGTFAYPYLWAYQRILFGRNAGLSAVDGINHSGIPVKIIHGTADWLILYDSAGIIAHRDSITNPNVQFVTHDTPHNNCHMNLLMTQNASAYASEIDDVFFDLLYRYTGTRREDTCIFATVHFHHVHMIANRNITRCFCSQLYQEFIPQHVLSNFFAGIDRHRISELNLELMDSINAFFYVNIR